MTERAQIYRQGADTTRGTSPPHESASVTSSHAAVEEAIRRYRQTRDRRRVVSRLKNEPSQHELEAASVIRYALIWAPFGGPPAGETFVKFGISRRKFVRKALRTLIEIDVDPVVARVISTTYAPLQD